MKHRGFTLLEILVVIVIFSVLSGFVILSLRGVSDADRLTEAADRFAALVEFQCEEAMLGGRTIRLQVDDSGYRFEVATRTGWLTPADSVFRARTWPVPLTARLRLDGQVHSRAEDTGISCLPTGEITPFELQLLSGNASRAGVRATPAGTVERFGEPE